MTKDLKTCYLIGGPHDLTKRSIAEPPIEMIFFEPVEKVEIKGSKTGKRGYVRCCRVYYKLSHATDSGALIYAHSNRFEAKT